MAYVYAKDSTNASFSLRAAGTSTVITGISASAATAAEIGELQVNGVTVWASTLDPTAPAAIFEFPDDGIPVPTDQAVTFLKKTAGVRYDVTLFYEG